MMIPSHTAGMARLRVDWHTPDRSASSRWKAPVARNPSVVSTCVGTDNPWLLAVWRSRAGRSSAHSSSNTGLGKLNRLMSQSSSFANVGAYGRESDGGVLGRSAFGSRLAEGNLNLPAPAVLPGTTTPSPNFFLGDEAFPLQVNLMRPYPGSNLQDRKRIYNYRQARARRVVENAFGILAARFRIFGRPIDCQPEKAVKIVKACVALHNFLASTERARYMPASFVDTTADTGEVQPGEWRQHVEGDRNMVDGPRCSVGRARPSQRAALVREQLADYFLSDAGVFPHQYNVLRLGTDQ
ncbi:uncharacterized protein LOC130372647 isoform X2 [Gadus chalcogrammus]|uniref:uncharacterized protein LOC130372647 isoform X2 n=1 Tax=Gadus chalcogrammus TaxID=1042646 RepID=UPI0024C4CCBE|nr:uncharacterized protein LOC130372647 isoform X2 [Gadus chalcogrammus]